MGLIALDKTKDRGKTDIDFFVELFVNFFDMDFCKNICMVFLNSPYQETPKNVLKPPTFISVGRFSFAGPSFRSDYWRRQMAVLVLFGVFCG
jgi:hypothetical protein